jgi:lipoprotein-anchoring transpeptidase ErfK/SrfK
MTMTVLGGSEGPRAESGGLMEEDYSLVFQTGKKKVIDISIGRQTLTLLEDDEPIFTALVGTGVRGADTPLGTYQVHGKVPRARFRGVNVNGSRYDIPNVNWVLPFWGDYAIHGAHWRGNFGVQASNGCVGMTDANAKVVYDWADEGTTVYIHR